MSGVFARMAGGSTLAAFGNLAVAVAAVVVVLAIGTVIVMVLRSNGAARRVSGGLGYDAHQGPMDQPHGNFDPAAGQWGRAPGAPGGWQGNGPDFAAPGGAPAAAGRGAPAGWGQGFDDPQQPQQPAQPAGGAWGAPSGARWGDAPAQAAGNAWGQPERQAEHGWNSGAGTPPPMGDAAARGQGQNSWDTPAAGAGAPPAWGQPEPAAPAQGGWGQSWGAPPPPAAGAGAPPAWGQPEPAAPAQGGWGATPQAAAPAQAAAGWGMPPSAAPGTPAGGASPTGAAAWGSSAPAAPAEPAGWGAPGSPSGPSWGAPQNAASAPAAPGWGAPQNAPAAPAAPGWGQDVNRAGGAAPAGPGFDAPGFGQAPMGQPFGSDLDKTYVARPAAGSQRPGAVVVRQGKEPGRVFEIRGDKLTIGRSRDSDVFLEDLAVSRLHATVFRDEGGQYIVRDENSANGTTVNGQRIGEHVLDEGDEIALGQTVLAFVRR